MNENDDHNVFSFRFTLVRFVSLVFFFFDCCFSFTFHITPYHAASHPIPLHFISFVCTVHAAAVFVWFFFYRKGGGVQTFQSLAVNVPPQPFFWPFFIIGRTHAHTPAVHLHYHTSSPLCVIVDVMSHPFLLHHRTRSNGTSVCVCVCARL